MQNRLVIVESPKKAQLIQGFLKDKKLKGYTVRASAGHVRDLKKKGMGVDIANNYTPEYEVSADKKALIKELKAEAKKADMVYLASDEDREGEAIAWHLFEALDLTKEKTKRIVFHEITSEAFMYALEHPRDIDLDLVDAQQARRVLDRIVGFELSPVLWRRIKASLSAGRVQSVAVRLIVDKEREINAFQPTSAYRLQAVFTIDKSKRLSAELNHRFATEEEATDFLLHCKQAQFSINDITSKAGKRSPGAPFTTSTLQQEAANRLGYSVSQTMRLAQSLYESGHITYMRTDSVNLSSTAISMITQEISTVYGEQYLQPRTFVTKSKGAQEAHEAIRPTQISRRTLEDATPQEQRLYELIRRRTIATQMADARIERTIVTINVPNTSLAFVAQGEVISFPGYLHLYSTDNDYSTSEGKLLPPLKEGDMAVLNTLDADQRYTQRPARYSEASMVSKMEELGIGRPSTYAPTIQTIQARGYVERGDREGMLREVIRLKLDKNGLKRTVEQERYGSDKGKLIPTDIGLVVNDFLVEHFPNIVDYNFTARVEEEFDLVAEGKLVWQKLIGTFYDGFHPNVEQAAEFRPGESRVGTRVLGTDPATGAVVQASIGRYGPMIQIGVAEEDGPKPRYASLQPNQSIETITLEEALALFALPRKLGLWEDKELTVGVGRFGPYVKYDGRFVSIPKELDPLALTAEEAIRIIKDKQEQEEKSLLKTFDQEPELEVRQGRFGPYIKYKGQNYKIPKGTEIEGLTLDDCQKLVAATPASKARGSKAKTPSKRTTKAKA